jgi:transposase
MAEPVRARRLTDQEGRRLLQIVRRGKHGPVRVRRAMIIMTSASGTLVPAIARLVAADEDTVRDVIHTFNAKGLTALDPRWAGGRPRLISDGDIEVIVTAARTRPEKLGQPFTHWSLRKLGAAQTAGTAARDLSSHSGRENVELCFTPATASRANPIEAQFGPVRTFVMGGSDYRNHRALARVRSERQQRRGRPEPKAA